MRHLYECPLRWADLDLLGHINNVVYVDYLQEARVDMLRVSASERRSDDLAEGVVVVRHEVAYVNPLAFRFAPVRIESWVTEIRAASFTVAYEVFDVDGEDRRVYLRASTVLTPYVFATERPRRITPEERVMLERFLDPGPPVRTPPAATAPDDASRYSVHVRFSDVDVYGHVNNVKYFEFFQEARISLFADLGREHVDLGGVHTVLAQSDVDYRRPILFRQEPYECRSWVTAVGHTSMTLASEIRDGDEVLSRCRTVAVCFDAETQRPAPLPESLHAAMVAVLPE